MFGTDKLDTDGRRGDGSQNTGATGADAIAFCPPRRRPLPRFTALRENDRAALRAFFKRLAEGLRSVLVPGAHVFIATNPSAIQSH